MPGLQRTVTIAAPPERVWAVVVDVERWPERIPTVDAIERLDAGPLAVGSRTRLQQPRLPTAVWTVTELADGSSYTWESSSPGVTITATHVVEPHPAGSRLTLALRSRGQRQPADRPDLRRQRSRRPDPHPVACGRLPLRSGARRSHGCMR